MEEGGGARRPLGARGWHRGKVNTGTLERVKQRWASAGASAPHPVRKGAWVPRGQAEARQFLTPPTSSVLPENQVSPFQVVPNFPTEKFSTFFFFWRPSFFPSCGWDWVAAELQAWQKRFHRGMRVQRLLGVEPPRTMRAPKGYAVRNSSNPSCWNARRRRLLHSGAKCVCHYSIDRLPARQPAPPSPPRYSARSERAAGLAPSLLASSLIAANH